MARNYYMALITNKRFYVLIITTLLLTNCSSHYFDDHGSEITDSISYVTVTGNYEFKPQSYQTEYLKIAQTDSLVLTISQDSIVSLQNRIFKGKYTLVKFQKDSKTKPTKIRSGQWEFLCVKNENGSYSSWMHLQDLDQGKVGISFKITQNASGRYFINGYEQNEEGAERYTFKKIEPD
ncbi:hypothetical protein [Pedobacter duraquae]|uniref:Uncharacterized protein n=1 Tax=Pedobacter duraquae TaxID=425511 RepID=A0A4V3C3A4_9SPHI|nr:hypothetical protein [Pedobacter duraquae]TDO21319.1 hypothetical protein CLV32_2423 [Pedobacter duraquae]